MEELVKLVSKKTGLSEDVSRQAATVVIDFLKSKLPAPLASQLDAVLGGSSPDLGGLASGLGGLFGK
jgi:hypothetical protein